MLTGKMIKKAAASKGATIDFSGSWTNQLGSTMDLSQKGEQITGTYTSSVSGGGGTVQGDLSGWVDEDLIAFTVNWKGAGSLTAWTGQLAEENKVETITTLWHLVMNVEDDDEDTDLWKSTFAGTDKFTRK